MGEIGTAPRRRGQRAENHEPVAAETLEHELTLIEREDQQNRVGALINEVATTGRGRIAALQGAPGMGKTSLLEWCGSVAGRSGFTVLVVDGAQLETDRAFGLVKRLFEPLFETASEAERAALLGEWREVIGPLLGLFPQTSSAPQWMTVHDGLDAMMANLINARGAIALVIDDAHWADEASLRWLASYVHRVPRNPVFLVAAYRPNEAREAAKPLLDALVGRAAAEDRLVVRGASQTAVGQLIRLWRDGEVPHPEFVDLCHQTTRGELHTLRELVREASSRGIPFDAPPVERTTEKVAGIVRNIHGTVLEERFENLRLGDAPLRLARAVAVLSTEAELGRVAELAGLDSGAARRVAEALRTAQILNRNRTLAFTHPLIAEAVYRHCTDGAERFELHTKAAELLLRDGRGAALAATHLQGLEACGDPWVCEVLLKAAREYLRIGAPEEAARVLRRAIDEPAPPGQRAELYAELGRATFLYAPEDSIAPFEQALEADRNDRRLRHPIIINLARAYGFNDRLRQAVELLQDEAAAVGVSKLRRRFLAEHYMWAAFWTEDRGFLDRARTLSRMIGHTRHFDDRASRSLSAVHGWYTVLRGHPSSTAVKHAGQALGAVDDSDDWEGMSWCEEDWGFEIPMMIVLTYIYSDQFMKAEKLLKEGQRELRENGRQGTHMSYCHAFFAMLYHRWGRLEEAHRHAEEALFLSEKLGQAPPARWYAAGILIQVLIARGEVEKAQKLHDRTDFTRGSAQARVFPVPQIVCAELHLAAGRPQKAIPFLEELRDLLEAAGMDNPAWCPWEILLAQAYREAGYRTEARRTALSAERRAMWFGAPVTIGQACRVSGTVMEKQAGLTRFETALILLNDVGSRYEHALTMFEYGMRLRSIDDFFEAAHVFVQAMEEAQACGARALVRRVELALQAVLEVTGPAKPEGHSVFDAPGLLGDAPWTSEELSDGLSDGLSEELSEGFGGSEGHGIAPFDPPDDPGAPGHDGPPAPGW